MTHWLSRWLKPSTALNAEAVMLKFAQTGKPELLDDLVNRHGNDLYHFLLSQSDASLAADISQSTWLKVIEKRQYYQASGRFKSWLFTLGRHLLVDHLRVQNRWQTIELEEDMQISAQLNETVEQQMALEQFNRLLDGLPFLQKEAFILQKEGFSVDEIANITGENSETIKSRLRYARNQFKTMLAQHQEAV